MTPKTVTSVPAKIVIGHEAAAVCCKMLQTIFVFKSSQGDVDTVTMEHQDSIITAISEQIGDQKVLQAVRYHFNVQNVATDYDRGGDP